MWEMKKIFTRAAAIIFFNQFNWILLTERIPLIMSWTNLNVSL